jgi:hypothetical protein
MLLIVRISVRVSFADCAHICQHVTDCAHICQGWLYICDRTLLPSWLNKWVGACNRRTCLQPIQRGGRQSSWSVLDNTRQFTPERNAICHTHAPFNRSGMGSNGQPWLPIFCRKCAPYRCSLPDVANPSTTESMVKSAHRTVVCYACPIVNLVYLQCLDGIYSARR